MTGTESRTPYTILGCLTHRPMSGYDVKQFLERTVVHFWSESFGQIYPALRRLEEEGLVEGRVEPGERGREKTVYRITEAGRQRLAGWLERPAEPVRPRYEHSLKLFFGHVVGPETSLEHVERLRRESRERLDGYRAAEAELRERLEEDDAPEHLPYWLAVLRGGVLYDEMVLSWCDEVEAMLASDAASGAAP
ncbi:MAG: PadR family transcriptional regulator [Gemmatimonadota bacterium]|nr:PadR family transcriptional regulator [Gemmatimonadota bacterium]